MKNRFTRRWVVSTAGAAASVTVLGQPLFNVGKALAAVPFVRRDVGGISATDPIIVSYRKAIKAMQALPVSDPRSWAYQAAIHGTLLSPVRTAWNTCEHGTYFFWSWHRMYLYWFERIIRKMSGDKSWALPYWNWTSPTERQLPAMFRDATSELYTPNRRAAMNNGSGSLPASDVAYSAAFAFVNFTTASSSLQGTPHGAVHVDVGGWMGSVPTAAQDPIFYLHHCNIDRLWDLWLAQGGGRTDPLSDASWKNKKYTFFRENRRLVRMVDCDVLRAAQQLNYTYEGEGTQVNEYCQAPIKLRPPIAFVNEVLFQPPGPPVDLTSERVSFPLDIQQLRPRIAAIAESKTETLLLELDDVEAERQPGVVWEVYVGLPENATPDPESPYFVGTMALFGAGIRGEARHEFKPARFAFAINRAILAALKANEERVLVTFMPHGILINGRPSRPEAQSAVRIGRASVTVQMEKHQ